MNAWSLDLRAEQQELAAIAEESIGWRELRGPGFHADVLQKYADIDITLAPFPFIAGLTSFKALWMGVPMALSTRTALQ